MKANKVEKFLLGGNFRHRKTSKPASFQGIVEEILINDEEITERSFHLSDRSMIQMQHDPLTFSSSRSFVSSQLDLSQVFRISFQVVII